MFDRFGEFDSAAELNATAEGLLKEGDTDSIYVLAEENGIDREDAEDYITGAVTELAKPLMAVMGKLKVEAAELKVEGILADWKDQIIDLCTEDEKMCAAVRSKDKCLRDCMAALIKFSFENKVQVSNKIVKATKVMHDGKLEPMREPLYLGIPNRAEAKRIIRDYYRE